MSTCTRCGCGVYVRSGDDWDEDVWATFLMGDMKRGGEQR
jgi:hypothetical protein